MYFAYTLLGNISFTELLKYGLPWFQGEPPSSLSSLTKTATVMEEPRPVDITLTGDIHLPASDVEIILPPKDDAAEYDDSAETQQFHDDPK